MISSILFLGKKDDVFCQKAVDFIKMNFQDALVVLSARGDPWPEELNEWQGDFIISYLSPFIVPKNLLDRAGKAAINFHPGPPEYPGIGCTNFALYDGVGEFGVTCHHMAAKVDTGLIISVRRFPILKTDSVYSLTQRCYASIFDLFFEVMADIVTGGEIAKSSETWTRQPFRRFQLDELCRIEPTMSAVEIQRRLRAVTFPNAQGAYVDLHGHRFAYVAAAPAPGKG